MTRTIPIELKVVDYSVFSDPQFVHAISAMPIKTISLGSDSCYRQLPDSKTVQWLIDILKPRFEIKFIVPILFESHFDKVTQLVDSIIDRIDTLCVNDMGMLAYASKHYGSTLSRVSIGNVLYYSYLECPWNSHITADEPVEIQKSLSLANFNSVWVEAELGKFGFTYEFEVPMIEKLRPSCDHLRMTGSKVNLGLDIVPVSFGRACHSSRFHKVSVDACQRNCHTMVALKTTHRWDFFEAVVTEIKPVVQKQMPEFLVWGNAIYTQSLADINTFDFTAADSVVIDIRMCDSIDSLHGLIDRICNSESSEIDQHAQVANIQL